MTVNVSAERNRLYYCSADSKTDQSENEDSFKKASVKNGTLFVGDMQGTMQDTVFEKKMSAQKEAMRTLMKQFASDQQYTDALDELHNMKSDYEAEEQEYMQKIDDITKLQEDLAAEYGVEEGSEEAENLEILRKAIKSPASLTDEEFEKLSSMDSITEYQQRVLDLDAAKNVYETKLDDLTKSEHSINQCVDAMKLANCKNDGMVQAQKDADNIREAAIKEIIGMLWDDAKAHIDGELEEAKEKAIEEEKEEEQDTTAQTAEESAAEISDNVGEFDKLRKTLINNVKASLMTEDEIKGLVVDQTV